jgi:hypothetical protein
MSRGKSRRLAWKGPLAKKNYESYKKAYEKIYKKKPRIIKKNG